jgi:hypothetical protein
MTRRRERLATSPILGGTRAQLSMPDPGRAAALLLLAQGSRLVWMDAVDPRFPAGGKQVRDLLALTGPASNGGCGAVLEIVRVGSDTQRALPVLAQRRQGWELRHLQLLGGLVGDRMSIEVDHGESPRFVVWVDYAIEHVFGYRERCRR